MYNKTIVEVCRIIPCVGGKEVGARKGGKDTAGQQRHNHFEAKTIAILNCHCTSLALFDELIYELMKMFDNSQVFDNNSFDNVNGKYDASSCIGMKKESY